MNLLLRYLFLFFLVCTFSTSKSQDDQFTVNKKIISYLDGLPGHEVVCGIQDNQGFLWFGTNNGLCRYDGYRLKVFTQKNTGLRGKRILSLAKDNKNGLIISYSEAGSSTKVGKSKDVLNTVTLEVSNLKDYFRNMPFTEEEIYEIKNDYKKDLLVFTKHDSKGIWFYKPQSGFTKCDRKTKYIFEPVPSSKSTFAKHEKELTDYFPTNREIVIYNDSSIAFASDHKGFLLNTYQDKFLLCHFDTITKVYSYSLFGNDGSVEPVETLKAHLKDFSKYDAASLTPPINDSTVLIQEKSGNNVLYIPSVGFLSLFRNNESKVIRNVKVNSYFIDNLTNYWFCTNEGIIKVNIRPKLFTPYFTTSDKQEVGANHSVRGIYADDNMLCAALFDFFALKDQSQETNFRFSNNYGVLKTKNDLWIGSFGLRQYNFRSKLMIENKVGSLSREIWSLFELNEKEILLGCTDGLDIYNKESNSIKNLSCGPFPVPKFVYKIFRNKSGLVSIVSNNGFYILNSENKIVHFYAVKNGNTGYFPFSNLHDVYQDNDGVYWLATGENGLYKWDGNKRVFRQYAVEDGFISNTLYCIQEDKSNNLWISTDYGISRFNKLSENVKTFTQMDGLPHDEFNRSSSFKDKNGLIYFGCMNGIVKLNPNDFNRSTVKNNYPLLIDDFSLFNSTNGIFENKLPDLNKSGEIVLTDDHKLFNLSFVLLDFEDRLKKYTYKLEGLKDKWNIIDENVLRIGNLDYGSYTLRIRAQTADGTWNKQEIVVPLIVVMPFYKSWWFIISLSVFLIGLTIILVKLRIRYLKKRNSELEKVIELRTNELKMALDEQIGLMQEIHHRVKNNLQFIASILEMQINSVKTISDQETLKDTSRRINAISLVHKLLYNKDKLESISLKEYLSELTLRLSEMTIEENKNIAFSVSIDDVYFNVNKCVAIGIITSELISNSIKYAFENVKSPKIEVSFKYLEKEKKFVLKISDNGPGYIIDTVKSGLGTRLIDIFKRQLKANYRTEKDNLFINVFEFEE